MLASFGKQCRIACFLTRMDFICVHLRPSAVKRFWIMNEIYAQSGMDLQCQKARAIRTLKFPEYPLRSGSIVTETRHPLASAVDAEFEHVRACVVAGRVEMAPGPAHRGMIDLGHEQAVAVLDRLDAP